MACSATDTVEFCKVVLVKPLPSEELFTREVISCRPVASPATGIRPAAGWVDGVVKESNCCDGRVFVLVGPSWSLGGVFLAIPTLEVFGLERLSCSRRALGIVYQLELISPYSNSTWMSLAEQKERPFLYLISNSIFDKLIPISSSQRDLEYLKHYDFVIKPQLFTKRDQKLVNDKMLLLYPFKNL